MLYDFGTDPELEHYVDRIDDHNWIRKKLYFHVHWELGDKTWEPLEHCIDLIALEEYLKLKGVNKPEQLPRRPQ